MDGDTAECMVIKMRYATRLNKFTPKIMDSFFQILIFFSHTKIQKVHREAQIVQPKFKEGKSTEERVCYSAKH
jgi:hypothetical protein